MLSVYEWIANEANTTNGRHVANIQHSTSIQCPHIPAGQCRIVCIDRFGRMELSAWLVVGHRDWAVALLVGRKLLTVGLNPRASGGRPSPE